MSHRMGAKGQVVNPKDLRDALGIEPGDEVSFWRDGDHVSLRLVRTARPLRGRFRYTDLVEVLEKERPLISSARALGEHGGSRLVGRSAVPRGFSFHSLSSRRAARDWAAAHVVDQPR